LLPFIVRWSRHRKEWWILILAAKPVGSVLPHKFSACAFQALFLLLALTVPKKKRLKTKDLAQILRQFAVCENLNKTFGRQIVVRVWMRQFVVLSRGYL